MSNDQFQRSQTRVASIQSLDPRYKCSRPTTRASVRYNSIKMKFAVLSLLVAVACADRLYEAPAARAASDEIAILRDDRVIEDDGRYNFDAETANGIVFSESGSPVGDEGAINSAGSFSYTAPDGTDVHLQYVADEKIPAQGPTLAPEFPHPIPQFVLDQIAFAAEEDARQARGEVSRSYGAPHDD
nr:cuticle protein AM/CP1114-like [Penaeus vannamei]